jgi:FkbM family methyltransferase
VAKLPLRQRIRAEVAAHPPLWRFYRGLRSRLLYECPEPGPIHRVLRELAVEGGAVRFVQVGSNDAVFGDPIMEFVLACGWSGVLVEPVPYVFERLQARQGRNPRLRFENAAIGQFEGTRPFYCMEPLDRPLSRWYDQMGSFSREHIEKHERFTPGLSAHIREIQVNCLPLSALLRKHAIAELDLLHVDAEGHDFEVLRSLDFAQCSPGLVLFESGHLPRAERAACAEFLEERGYRLLQEGVDCLALHTAVRPRWPQTTVVFDAYSPEP